MLASFLCDSFHSLYSYFSPHCAASDISAEKNARDTIEKEVKWEQKCTASSFQFLYLAEAVVAGLYVS